MQTTIYKNTFRGCTSLTSMSLPNSITAIDDCAFKGCSKLRSVNMGENVKFIGLSAFYGDSDLTWVDRFNDTDPNHTFDMVGNHAFYGTGLTAANLALRSSTIYTFWGDSCFEKCENLKSVRILSAPYMSKNMFKDCTSLTSITFNKNMMAYTYPGIFEGCTALRSVKLPSKLLVIPENMFKDCTSLTSLEFSDYSAENSGINLVQRNAFYNTPKMQNINLPASIYSLEQIDDAALSNSNVECLHLHGIPVADLGIDYKFPNNMQYGVPYTVKTVNEMKSMVKLAELMKCPLAIFIEFSFNYYESIGGCDTETRTAYLSRMTGEIYNKENAFGDNVIGTAEQNIYKNMTSRVQDISKASHTNATTQQTDTYDFSRRKFIYVHVVCDLGTIKYYDKLGISEFRSPKAMYEQYIKKAQTEYRKNKNYDYNILTYLLSKSLVAATALTVTGHNGICYLATAKYMLGTNSSTGLHLHRKVSLKIPYTCNEEGKKTLNDIIYAYMCRGDTSIWDTGSALHYLTPIEVPEVQQILLAQTLKNTGVYRANFYENNASITLIGNVGTQLTITRGNVGQRTRYVDPPTYDVDTETKDNFKCGTWYYNAKEVHEYAKRNKIPALFIYSLLGCGPCQDYQKYIWSNAGFQNWIRAQQFLVCGLEVDKQPYYDTQAAYCRDVLSKSALNFKKDDQSSVQPNAFGGIPSDESNSKSPFLPATFSSSTLMTPVLVFMDANGNCWDYSYHNIGRQIQYIGVDGVIQYLKSLCLYHFDNNDIENSKYTVAAGKAFNIYDFFNLNPDNEWNTEPNVIDLNVNGIKTVSGAIDNIRNQLKNAGIEFTGTNVYIGGCLVFDIDYLCATFGSELEQAETSNAMNEALSKWYFKIGQKYYQLQLNDTGRIKIKNPCGENEVWVYKITASSFVEKQYTPTPQS